MLFYFALQVFKSKTFHSAKMTFFTDNKIDPTGPHIFIPMPPQSGDLKKLRWRCALGCNHEYDAPDSTCPRIYTKSSDISGVQKHVGEYVHFEKYYQKYPLSDPEKLQFIKGGL